VVMGSQWWLWAASGGYGQIVVVMGS